MNRPCISKVHPMWGTFRLFTPELIINESSLYFQGTSNVGNPPAVYTQSFNSNEGTINPDSSADPNKNYRSPPDLPVGYFKCGSVDNTQLNTSHPETGIYIF